MWPLSRDLESSVKRHRAGTHRVCSPAETVRRVRPLFSSAGITRVANVTGLDVLGIPTVMVIRPNGRSLSVCQGKGPDLDSARASGVMEALEHHVAENARGALVFESAAALGRTQPLIDVQRLPRFVRPYSADERILWTWGDIVPTGQRVLVPYEMVHLNLTLPLPPQHGFFPIGSNGLASGNTTTEAVIHGMCELIERDALSVFYQQSAGRQQARRVDPASIDDPLSMELLERYRRAAVRIGVWDVSSDISVSCFLCIAVDEQHDSFRPIGPVRGSGCHPDRAVALSRALCETAQSRLTKIAASRDDIHPQRLERQRSEQSSAAAADQLEPPRTFLRRFADAPSRCNELLDEDLSFVCEQLTRAGMREIVAVPLSSPEVPFAVVRVLIPGLEGVSTNPGYRPGPRALAGRAS